MKKLILTLALFSTLSNAATIVCQASVANLGIIMAAPYLVSKNLVAQNAVSLAAHPKALVIKLDSSAVKSDVAAMKLELINQHYDFSTLLSLKINSMGQLAIRLDSKSHTPEIHTLNMGQKMTTSVARGNGQTLDISCGYGHSTFSGI